MNKEIKRRYELYKYQVSKLKEFGITHDEALVLRTICDMYSNAGNDFVIHENDKYVWINLTYMWEFLDILGSKKTIVRMFDKFVEKGLIDKVVKKSRNGKTGTYGYYKPTEKLSSMEEIDSEANNINASNTEDKMSSNQKTKCRVNRRQNVLSSEDKMSSNQKTKCPSKDSTSFDSTSFDSNKEKDVERFLSLYPNTRGIGRINGRIEKLIQTHGMEQMERCINRYLAYLEKNKSWLKDKDLSTFVNSGHQEYLDKNFKVEQKLNIQEQNRYSEEDESKYNGMKDWA